MRKITQMVSNAFENKRPFASGNSSVIVDYKGDTFLYLHGNLIAQNIKGTLYVTNAGYFTNVTKERLNGLYGVSVYQKKGIWYLNGKEWNGELTKVEV